MTTAAGSERDRGRLDQWLWFARVVKSRSLAARLCAGGMVSINDAAVRKPNQIVRPGDVLVVRLRSVQRTLRVLALGLRRGPASEARALYEELGEPQKPAPAISDWVPLLGESDQTAEPAPP